MGGESPKPASTPTGAVFLSYASEDAEAAERIATALRAADVEVWFDRRELRGGSRCSAAGLDATGSAYERRCGLD